MTRLDHIEVLAAQVHAGSEKGSAPEQLAEEVQELAPLLREWVDRRATAMAGLDGEGMDAEEWLRRFTEMWDAEGTACDALLAALRDGGR